MEYIYGAMLLHKAGKDITSDALKATLSAAGVTVDDSRVKATAAALKDVDVEKVISETQIASAAAPVAAAPVEASDKGASEAPAKEEPKAAADEEVSEGLGALFG